MRAAGLRVWFDEWVIKPGDDIFLQIERGLQNARTLILCMSPAAFGSDWVASERNTVLFRDPTNRDRRFIPLLLADCEIPDTLRRYKYVDYRSDVDRALDELLTVLLENGHPVFPRRKKITKQVIQDSISALDIYEKAVLREFFIQRRNTILVPEEDIAVIGLLQKGIIQVVGDGKYLQ